VALNFTTLNLTVIWLFLLGAYELMIEIFVSREKFNNYAENIGGQQTKFTRSGDQTLQKCGPLFYRCPSIRLAVFL
jgi:hypothetical protein